jgi:oligopeptide transport system substrate-binding protein
MSCINERKTAFLELITNKLDYLFGLESSYVNELVTSKGELQPAQRDHLNFNKSPYLNTEYVGFNTQTNSKALMNKKVRQALNYALDRRAMLKALRNNVGVPANAGFVPKGLPSFDPNAVKGYNYDPDKARKLLSEAGYPEGKNLGDINLMTSQDYLDLCTFMAHQWAEIGVNCKIDVMEAATIREMMSKGQSPMFRGSWIADYPDPESFLGVFYSKNPSPPNYTRFNNSQFDLLYEQSLKENDDAKRYSIYQKMDNILIEEAPVVFLFYDEIASFSKKKVKNLTNNPINLLNLKKVMVVDK